MPLMARLGQLLAAMMVYAIPLGLVIAYGPASPVLRILLAIVAGIPGIVIMMIVAKRSANA
jgi:hypothetical protein